jgi:hypothetical protein
MAGYWLKLYTEILEDPKYHRLSDTAKLGMIELMLVAKKVDMDGEIPSIEDVSFYTRRSVEWWKPVFEELLSIEYLVTNGTETIIRKFAERQAALEPAERQRLSREIKHKKEFRHEPVTDMSQKVTERREETETETDKSREEVESAASIPPINPLTGEYESNPPNQYEPADDLFCDDAFLRVTGFYPTERVNEVRRTIKMLSEKHKINDRAKMADHLRPFYLESIKRKNKQGQNYQKSNTFWILEWAATGEIPAVKSKDTFKQQSQEEINKLREELRKGNK